MQVMPMKAIRYTEADIDRWDRFVGDSRNGTFMQERKFIGYHGPQRFQDCSLMFYDGRGNLTAVLPAAVKKTTEKTFFSHPGASHGGVVVNQSFGTSEALSLVRILVENCRAGGFKAIEIKPVPRIYQRWPCDEIDFALRRGGFFPAVTELATVLPLGEITAHSHFISGTALRNARKAERAGVVVKETVDYTSYWDMLENNLGRRYGAKPTHTLGEIKELTGRYPGQIRLLAAFCQEVMIAGVVIFLLNSRVINCFYIAQDYDYQQLRPLNLVFYRLINWGGQEGYRYLDWGISTEDKGRLVNHGLFRFKEEFGGRGLLRETYRLEL
jgi:hypothetical protein